MNAFSPASTSFHAIVLPCFAAAASMTSWAAGQMSTPVPSPSMNGMIGSSGTDSTPLAHRDLVSHGRDATVAARDLRRARDGARRRPRAVTSASTADGTSIGQCRRRRGAASLSRPALVERLLHDARLHDDLDPPVACPARGGRVRRDGVAWSPSPSGNSRDSVDADRHEVLRDRVGAGTREIQVRRVLPAGRDRDVVGVAVDQRPGWAPLAARVADELEQRAAACGAARPTRCRTAPCRSRPSRKPRDCSCVVDVLAEAGRPARARRSSAARPSACRPACAPSRLAAVGRVEAAARAATR